MRKMNLLPQIILTLLLAATTINAQNTEEYWDTYLATYEEGKVGSTTVRMDLIDDAPFEKFPIVLVTGITYESSRENGFPEEATFDVLHQLGDELVAFIAKETPSVLVGSFMFNKERLEYFFIKEDKGLKEKLEKFYKKNYKDYKFYINIKEDKEWTYYKNFLYPNEETRHYMGDQSVVMNLFEAGDPLTKARRVDHWLYFSDKSEMNKCKAALELQNFSIESAGENKKSTLSFQLQIWRVDEVNIDAIYGITSSLRKIAKKYNGDYDGWETSVEK